MCNMCSFMKNHCSETWVLSWSSLVKEESPPCQITSPFNNKLSCFWKLNYTIALQKQPIFLLNGEVIWQASDSSLTKELHGPINEYNIRRVLTGIRMASLGRSSTSVTFPAATRSTARRHIFAHTFDGTAVNGPSCATGCSAARGSRGQTSFRGTGGPTPGRRGSCVRSATRSSWDRITW